MFKVFGSYWMNTRETFKGFNSSITSFYWKHSGEEIGVSGGLSRNPCGSFVKEWWWSELWGESGERGIQRPNCAWGAGHVSGPVTPLASGSASASFGNVLIFFFSINPNHRICGLTFQIIVFYKIVIERCLLLKSKCPCAEIKVSFYFW